MASQPESKVPGPGGTAGKDKRRSFLPAPKRSAIPSPAAASVPGAFPSESPGPTVRSQNDSPPSEPPPSTVEETIPGAEKLTVGRRILIGGVKPGILRFVGKTGLAEGFWCGIELFDASGLHDGEVDGTRYFTCKPFRGIFAPLDKVVVDESYKSPVRDEETPPPISEQVQETEQKDKPVLETVDPQHAVHTEVSKIPAPKSQIARLSGIPRIGPSSQGVIKSKSADGIKEATSKIAVFTKRSVSGQDASKVDLNSTFVRDDSKLTTKPRRRSEDSDGDFSMNQTYSSSLEKHLRSDSRQYLNITFSKDTPPPSNPTNNLPDVVSSASPSPPRETASRLITETLNQTQSAQDIASSIASDMSLGLIDPDIIAADDTNLLEGVISDRVAAATSESDVSLSGNSSTVEEISGATVDEVFSAGISSTPIHGVDLKKFLNENVENLSDHLSDADNGGTPTASIKQNLAQTFTVVSRKEELKEDAVQRKDSSSSISGISAVRADLLQEEGSNGVSPEVSQVLEWDYDHDAFDGKLLLEKCQDGMSTSTSDSCSEASADQGGALAEKIAHDGDEAHLFEESEDGFENIDNIEDFPLGMSKDTQHMMTDSGISEKGFLDPAAEAASKKKSVEFDSKVHTVDAQSESLPDNKVSVVDLPEEGRLENASVMDLPCEEVDRRVTVDANLQKDLMDGHAKQERPLSLVSTTSADTGYVPDTDSETGTLTTNSPTDWTERQLNANLAAGSDPRVRAHVSAAKAKQLAATTKGLPQETLKVADSNKSSNADTSVDDTVSERTAHTDEQERAPCHEESEENEGDDEEEDEESSEEETSSEEEEEEVADDDRPEDDRIEADRVGPSGDTRSAVTPRPAEAGNPPVADVAEVSNETSGQNSDMTESTNLPETGTGVVANTTITAGPAALDDPAQDEGPRATSADPSSDVSERPVETPGTITTSEGGEVDSPRPAPKKKLSLLSSSAADKKMMAEHKKVVKTAHSRLPDYIKTPPPPPSRAKEENKGELKRSKAGDAKTNKTVVGKKQDNGSGSSVADKTKTVPSGEKIEKKPAPVKEEKAKVKRAAPKSKWGNIMSQIEASKDTVKPKPKTEVKSSLAVYLGTPANTSPRKEAEKDDKAKQKEDNLKPKSKLKPMKRSKPDFSNVKSKLNLSSPPKQSSNQRDTSSSSRSSTPKESNSPKDPGIPKDSTGVFGNVTKDSANPKRSGNPRDIGNPKTGNPKAPGNPRGSGNVEERSSKTMLAKKTSVTKLKTGRLLMDHRETLDNCSTMSQASSRTDLSVQDDVDRTAPNPGHTVVEKKRNALSCAGSRQKNERSSSVASLKSDASSAQNAVKSRNLRNAPKHEAVSSNVSFSKRSTVKSSIPPPTPRTASHLTKPPLAGPAAARSKSSPPKLTPPLKAKKAASSTNSTAPTNRPGANQGLSRNKAGGGLKSGHPPDVVSTSARGSRAQEVARLESLCEARTKELNYTRMQLKAGLQAFDAMTCLLNYCTTQLNAFSCPAITAKLKTAEGKLTEQHELIERLTHQKTELDQCVEVVTGAKVSALQDVARLKQEMVQAEEAHTAGENKLKEEHATALKTLEEDLSSKHQNTVQQMQTFQEKQAEYSRQAQKRQIAELTAEHQMFTNQVKLAHLEEIQELRNKHDLQMEELHTQHRNKLEDITRRFESIKLSLSEKVQSLCVECDELRMRAKTSEEALQRDADVKVQLALAPFLHLPKEIESLKMVVDMRTEEIQKLRRHNMDLEKQLEELPIAQEKVASLQQKVENLQAIINIKTDHEKQLHEKCQVLMRKYDKENRANKRLSMDYEQVVWRMSQSADLTGSTESLGARQLSTSPSRSDDHSHSSSCPVRRSLSNTSHGGEGGGAHSPSAVARRQRKISGGDENFDRKIRCRSATFSLDKSKSPRFKAGTGSGMNGSSSSPGSPSKQPLHAASSSSGDYADLIVAAINSGQTQSFTTSEQGPADLPDVPPSMKSSVILETSRGVSYNIDVVENGEADDRPEVGDEVFTEPPSSVPETRSIPNHTLLSSPEAVEPKSEVTVVVNSPTSD